MKNGMKNLWNRFKESTCFHDFKCFLERARTDGLAIYQPLRQIAFIRLDSLCCINMNLSTFLLFVVFPTHAIIHIITRTIVELQCGVVVWLLNKKVRHFLPQTSVIQGLSLFSYDKPGDDWKAVNCEWGQRKWAIGKMSLFLSFTLNQ